MTIPHSPLCGDSPLYSLKKELLLCGFDDFFWEPVKFDQRRKGIPIDIYLLFRIGFGTAAYFCV